MRNIYKIVFSLFLGFVLLSFSSCEEWLDVKPKTQIDAEDLFDTEDGFKEALAGVYTAMSEENLYGKELTFGFNDALAQQWDITSSNNEYFNIRFFLFDGTDEETKILNIWSSAYNAIANVNSIIDVIDSKESVFLGDNYNIIKGEALAIRAYLHFDMLRLFGSIDFSEGGEVYIPYVTSLIAGITNKSNPNSIAELALQDLEDAAEHLANDPIKVGNISNDVYLANRYYHLNYYAVKGLMARIYLYMGNKELAFDAANEIIQAHENLGVFPWLKSEDITRAEREKRDRTFSTEHLFSLNIRNLEKYIQPYFRALTSNLLTRESIEDIYENIEEYRKTYLFETSGADANVPAKLWQEESDEPGLPKRDRMPMIRLSEMYYIAAEAKMETPDIAVGYLNEVRRRRAIDVDLPTNLPAEDVLLEVEKEYKKEFICEGQLFFFYKRLNRPIIGTTPVTDYVIPTPQIEDEYRGN